MLSEDSSTIIVCVISYCSEMSKQNILPNSQASIRSSYLTIILEDTEEGMSLLVPKSPKKCDDENMQTEWLRNTSTVAINLS